jgi:hypothetical protein
LKGSTRRVAVCIKGASEERRGRRGKGEERRHLSNAELNSSKGEGRKEGGKEGRREVGEGSREGRGGKERKRREGKEEKGRKRDR